MVLRMPCGAVDNPHDWLDGAKSEALCGHGPEHGDRDRRIYLAGLETVQAISLASPPDSGLVGFVLEALELIGVSKLPAASTVSKLLQKNLEKTASAPSTTEYRCGSTPGK